jgi:hypothetical protein
MRSASTRPEGAVRGASAEGAVRGALPRGLEEPPWCGRLRGVPDIDRTMANERGLRRYFIDTRCAVTWPDTTMTEITFVSEPRFSVILCCPGFTDTCTTGDGPSDRP